MTSSDLVESALGTPVCVTFGSTFGSTEDDDSINDDVNDDIVAVAVVEMRWLANIDIVGVMDSDGVCVNQGVVGVVSVVEGVRSTDDRISEDNAI